MSPGTLLRAGVFAFVSLCLPFTAHAAERVALIIGNAAYPEAPLRNPDNDARAERLQRPALTPMQARGASPVEECIVGHVNEHELDILQVAEKSEQLLSEALAKNGIASSIYFSAAAAGSQIAAIASSRAAIRKSALSGLNTMGGRILSTLPK